MEESNSETHFNMLQLIGYSRVKNSLALSMAEALMIEHTHVILANPDSPAVHQLEAKINKLVYKLYGLTAGEIAIVEVNKI